MTHTAIKNLGPEQGSHASLHTQFKLSATALALSCAITPMAMAADETQAIMLPEIQVEAQTEEHTNPNSSPESPWKADTLDSLKHGRPIAETPKSISVITRESIQDSGNTDLADVLKAQPGITIGTGEGGNAFGDRFIIRGFEARNDVFADGLRDPGVTTRETFALEQIEVSKGPSSTFAGRGTTGGAINNVSKKPGIIDFTTAEFTLGTDNRKRTTLDLNRKVSEKTGIRLNALLSDRDVPARDGATESRQGLALSLSHHATDTLVINADVYHFRADDVPDGGVPWDSVTGQPVPGRKFYGQKGRDFQDATSDIGTLGIEYELPNGSHIQNLTRYGITTNEYFVTIPGLGAVDPSTGQAYPAGTPIGVSTPGVFARASSQNRNQENTYFGNQTNWVSEFEAAGVEHNLVIGAELSSEQVENLPYLDNLRSPNAGDPLNPNPNAWLEQGGSFTVADSRFSRIDLDTWSVYVLDTARLNTDWEVFGGIRYDHFDYQIYSGPSDYQNGTELDSSDSFVNGHAGVTWSPWANGLVYTSISTSSNPTGEQLDAGANCDYGGLCGDGNTKPERNRSLELGTKWQLNGNRLLLTSALFQTVKSDVLSQQGRGGPITQVGELEVKGFELGLVGQLTPAVRISSGLAILDTEIKESDTPSEVGQAFPNTAEKSANVQARWQATPDWAIGGTATYTGEIFGGTPNGPVTNNSISSNTRYDLMAEYRYSRDLKFRLNVLNATDKVYYDALYRSGAPFTYVGEGRSTQLTMVVDF